MKNGTIRNISLALAFHKYEESRRGSREHFRVLGVAECLRRESSITGRAGWFLAMWRRMLVLRSTSSSGGKGSQAGSVWIPKRARIGGGLVGSINLSASGFPGPRFLSSRNPRVWASNSLVTENLVGRLASVEGLVIDSYVLISTKN